MSRKNPISKGVPQTTRNLVKVNNFTCTNSNSGIEKPIKFNFNLKVTSRKEKTEEEQMTTQKKRVAKSR